jgi:quercetin dioxygenase-like cupin family protein
MNFNEDMNLRQFARWWWREGKPLDVPTDPVRKHEGTAHLVLFRRGCLQVEQVVLYPNIPVPRHRHPDVETMEYILSGTGDAFIAGKRVPEIGRFLIPAGAVHWGMAHTPTVALSVQRWINNVSPTFITDSWIGEAPWQ